jgi:hypothetical protein
MRTTLTLDEDVAAILERLRKSRNASLKDLVNEALRQGLQRMTVPSAPRSPFQTRAVPLGRCRLGGIDNITDVLAASEGEAFK